MQNKLRFYTENMELWFTTEKPTVLWEKLLHNSKLELTIVEYSLHEYFLLQTFLFWIESTSNFRMQGKWKNFIKEHKISTQLALKEGKKILISKVCYFL